MAKSQEKPIPPQEEEGAWHVRGGKAYAAGTAPPFPAKSGAGQLGPTAKLDC